MRHGHTLRAAAAAALLGAAPAAAQTFTPYTPPPVRQSSGGVLNTTFTAAAGKTTLRGVTYTTNLLEDSVLPPVLKLQPGDSLALLLVNRIEAHRDSNWTNLHYHGFAVSPNPPADNVTRIHVARDSAYQYAMRLPADHPQGLFWYHPHPHGISYGQVKGGMAGAISIGDPRTFFPEPIRSAREVFVLLKFFEPNSDTSIALVNGVERIQFPNLAAGALQFWRIANLSAENYFNLQLVDGAGTRVPFQVLARDGNVVGNGAPVMEGSLGLGPSQRVEVIVKVDRPGEYRLRSVRFPPGSGISLDTVTLGRVRVTQPPAARERALAARDRRGGDPRERRLLDLLAAGDGIMRDTLRFKTLPGRRFLIDGKMYDTAVVNKQLVLGQTYEWTIRNEDAFAHVFHIHQGDFLVVSEAGVEMPANYRRDSVNLPPRADVVIRFTYERAATVGPFVYHCHLLFHEDHGMMANVVLHNGPPVGGAQGDGGGHRH